MTPLRAVGFGKSTSLTATVLTDTAANFPVPDSATAAVGLTGLRVNPNLDQAQTFQIADNTATTLTIAQGDLTTASTSGNLFLGVYTFDNLTIAGGARVITADAVSVRFTLSIDETSSLTSNINVRDIPLGTLATTRGTTRTLTATLPAPVGVPTRVVAVSGNQAIAAIIPTTVIPAGQSTVDLTVTAVSAGRTSFTIAVGTQIRMIRAAVDVPPPQVPLTMTSPVQAYVMGIPPGWNPCGIAGTGQCDRGAGIIAHGVGREGSYSTAAPYPLSTCSSRRDPGNGGKPEHGSSYRGLSHSDS